MVLGFEANTSISEKIGVGNKNTEGYLHKPTIYETTCIFYNIIMPTTKEEM